MVKKEIIIFSTAGLLLIILSAITTIMIVAPEQKPNKNAQEAEKPALSFFSMSRAISTCDQAIKKKFGNKLIAAVFDDRFNSYSEDKDVYMLYATIDTKENGSFENYGLLCDVSGKTRKLIKFKAIKTEDDDENEDE